MEELTYWRPAQLEHFNRQASAVLARGVALGVLPPRSAATLRWDPQFERFGLRLARVIAHLVDLHDRVYATRIAQADRGSPSAVIFHQLAWIDPKLAPVSVEKAELRRVAKQPGGAAQVFQVEFDHFLSLVEAECDRRELLRPPRPSPRVSGMTPQVAEHLVCEWVRHLGIPDAAVTRQSGDGGVDVTSAALLVQVKHYTAPVGVEHLRALHGVAVVHQKRTAFFTLTGYTKQAVEFGDAARMPLFIYSPLRATLTGANPLGRTCLDAGLGALVRLPEGNSGTSTQVTRR